MMYLSTVKILASLLNLILFAFAAEDMVSSPLPIAKTCYDESDCSMSFFAERCCFRKLLLNFA